MKQIVCAAILVGLAYSAFAEPCGSFRDARGRSSVDFAPPNGFVDVCSRDFQLCVLLTEGYPPEVTTVAYFVPGEEWQKYQKGQHKGFSRYLIAQRGQTRSPDEFSELKRYVKAQQGNVPDHTELPRILQSQGKIPLGVTEETEDSISFGVIMKLASADGHLNGSPFLACINIMLRLKGETLALYVHDTAANMSDSKSVRQLAKDWLKCIREQNHI